MARGRPAKLQAATPAILRFFAESRKRIYHLQDMSKILTENRDAWQLAASTTPEKLVKLLATKGDLREIQITPTGKYPNARAYTRYAWGTVSPFSVALSMRKRSYLSHGTAVFLRGLNEQLPRRIIYVNQEQSLKPQADPIHSPSTRSIKPSAESSGSPSPFIPTTIQTF